jgi:hypothetical protein
MIEYIYLKYYIRSYMFRRLYCAIIRELTVPVLIKNSELPDDGAIQAPTHVGADIIL